MKRSAHSGLKPQEQAIVDLRDQGWTPTEIADELGVKRSRVRSIIGTYGDVEMRDRAYARTMRTKSATFLARLQAEGMVIHG